MKVNGGWVIGSVPSANSVLLYPVNTKLKLREVIPAGFGKLSLLPG